jgi:hypothetical protein
MTTYPYTHAEAAAHFFQAVPAYTCALPLMADAVDEVLPGAAAGPEQRLRDMRGCPDPAHLFIEVLPKIGYVEDPAPIVETCVSQVLS